MVDALDGIRILDLTHGIAGPMGMLLLAEHGADVIKVEPPGGHRTRESAAHRVWDRSRRSIVLDLKREDGVARFLDLADTADVVVEDFRPGALGALGLGHEEVRARSPRLVWCSIPAYPVATRHAGRPGWDALVQARSGQQYEQFGWRPGPIFLDSPLPSMATAFLAPIGVLAALHARELTGRGQHVEASLLQGVLSLTTMLWVHTTTGLNELQGMMSKTYERCLHQGSIYQCADGEWVHATFGMTRSGRTMTEVIGLAPDTMMKPDATAQMIDAFKKFRRDELVELFHSEGLNAEPIVPASEVVRHPQLVGTDSVVEVVDPDVGRTLQLSVPMKLLGTPSRVRGPRPLLGEHTEEVLAELESLRSRGSTTRGPEEPSLTGSTRRSPLDGIRVLDFGRAFAGPFANQVLSSLGADVIKVNAIGAGSIGGASSVWLGCEQGKRVVAVDLKRPEGVAVVRDLVATADVVHHNMTLGVAERLGIDYASLVSVKPDLIYCNTYMYGPVGPLAEFGGLDPLAQAAAGLEHGAGPVQEGNPPLWYRFGHGDTANALASVVGVLTALAHRDRTGEGQELWASLLHGTAYMTSGAYVADDGPAPRPQLDRAQTGHGPLYRLYPTVDGWLQVAAPLPEHWERLCHAIGRPDLADDDRFATPEHRQKQRAELEEELAAVFRTRPSLVWRRALDDAGVPCEIPADTLDGESVLFDQQLVDLGLIAVYDHPEYGTLRQASQFVTFSETPGRAQGPMAKPGQHTIEVLESLGYDRGRIDALVDEGVVATAAGEART